MQNVQKTDRVFPCDCYGGHFLRISRWPDETDGYLSLQGDFFAPAWWRRVVMAWKILRTGGHVHSWVEVHLDDTTARQVRDAITEFITDTTAKEP